MKPNKQVVMDEALVRKAKVVALEIKHLFKKEQVAISKIGRDFDKQLKSAVSRIPGSPAQRYMVLRPYMDAKDLYRLVRRLGKKVISSPYKARGNTKNGGYEPSKRVVQSIVKTAIQQADGDKKKAKKILWLAYASIKTS